MIAMPMNVRRSAPAEMGLRSSRADSRLGISVLGFPGVRLSPAGMAVSVSAREQRVSFRPVVWICVLRRSGVSDALGIEPQETLRGKAPWKTRRFATRKTRHWTYASSRHSFSSLRCYWPSPWKVRAFTGCGCPAQCASHAGTQVHLGWPVDGSYVAAVLAAGSIGCTLVPHCCIARAAPELRTLTHLLHNRKAFLRLWRWVMAVGCVQMCALYLDRLTGVQ